MFYKFLEPRCKNFEYTNFILREQLWNTFVKNFKRAVKMSLTSNCTRKKKKKKEEKKKSTSSVSKFKNF